MSLEDLAQKSPKERIEAIKAFEEASRKRMGEALQACEKVCKRAAEVREKLATALGLAEVKMSNLAIAEPNLNPEDRNSWEQLKKLIDKIHAEQLKKSEITQKKPEKSKNTLNKSNALKV